jgi:UPF0042 nucleotide-binding protein
MKNKKVFIVTGMSGAGKSQALKVFEDFGFYCIDNLPVALLSDFAKLIKKSKQFENAALGIDVREGSAALKNLHEILMQLKKPGFNFRVIFLDAADNILIQRFSQTRHKHPLGSKISTAIKAERRKISKLKEMADKYIDTSSMTLSELKENLSGLLEIKRLKEMKLTVISFGYKYGIPVDSDIIMDVRFLKNPNYQNALKNKTGLDKPVATYILKDKHCKTFIANFTSLIKHLIPLYIKEGKSYLTIAIGCTGGKHRSVFVTDILYKHLKTSNMNVSAYHRDIKKQ